MLRTRLLAAAMLTATVLPGCGIFCGDRPGFCGRLQERRDARLGGGDEAYGMPVSFPGGMGGMGGNCGATVIPPGATIMPGNGGLGNETLPPPFAGGDQPRIPSPKIKENPGKQFELDPMSKPKGPVLTIPTTRSE